MKISILAAALFAFALAAPIVSAQETLTPAKPATDMAMNKNMPQMQENMKKMQQQMETLQATSDPLERQKLMREHSQAMQENMNAMRGRSGPMMMAGGMPAGGRKHKAGHEADHNMMRHHEMMEGRMEMMQMMMAQMILHAQMTDSIPAK